MTESTYADVFAKVEAELTRIRKSRKNDAGEIPTLTAELAEMSRESCDITGREKTIKYQLREQLEDMRYGVRSEFAQVTRAVDVLKSRLSPETTAGLRSIKAEALRPLKAFLKVLDALDNVLLPLETPTVPDSTPDRSVQAAMKEWKALVALVDGWAKFQLTDIVDYYYDMELDLHGEHFSRIQERIQALATDYELNDEIVAWLQGEGEIRKFLSRTYADIAILSNDTMYQDLGEFVARVWKNVDMEALKENVRYSCVTYYLQSHIEHIHEISDELLDVAIDLLDLNAFEVFCLEFWTKEQQAKVAAVRANFPA